MRRLVDVVLVVTVLFSCTIFANTSPVVKQKIGLNYYDAVVRVMRDGGDTDYQVGFPDLQKRGIPYVRLNGGGAYGVKDWSLYLENKETYFKRLNKVIKAAENNHLKLIFTLFWRYTAIPKLMGESISAYGDPNSKTIAFIRKYTKEIVTRYGDSPAILGWEFGNEYNLVFNLPFKHLKRFFPDKKDHRPENILRLKDFQYAMKVFHDTVRQYDKEHFISTGHSVFRTYIYGKITQKNYKQMMENIILQENKYADVISLHLYPWSLNKRKFFRYFHKDFDALIAFFKDVANRHHKQLFIGEFGFCRIKDKKRRYETFLKYLNAFRKYHVDYSAMWVYHRVVDQSCNMTDLDLNILEYFNNGESVEVQRIISSIKKNDQFIKPRKNKKEPRIFLPLYLLQ